MRLAFIIAATAFPLAGPTGAFAEPVRFAQAVPETLAPGGAGVESGEILQGDPPPLTPRPGTSGDVVETCRASVIEAARPLGLLHADAVSAGRGQRGADGVLVAPIEVRIIYSQGGVREVRQSRIFCHLDRNGSVIALDHAGDEETEPDELASEAPAFEEPGFNEPLSREPARDDATAFDDRGFQDRLPTQTDALAVVEAFYRALEAGDGETAAQYVTPEKRRRGPLSAAEMSRYFGGLRVPLRIAGIEAVREDEVIVRYDYGIGSRWCDGTAHVVTTDHGRGEFIESIYADENCR